MLLGAFQLIANGVMPWEQLGRRREGGQGYGGPPQWE